MELCLLLYDRSNWFFPPCLFGFSFFWIRLLCIVCLSLNPLLLSRFLLSLLYKSMPFLSWNSKLQEVSIWQNSNPKNVGLVVTFWTYMSYTVYMFQNDKKFLPSCVRNEFRVVIHILTFHKNKNLKTKINKSNKAMLKKNNRILTKTQ